MKLLPFVFLLSGCGLVTVEKHDTIVERGVDSAFFTHVSNFEYLSQTKVHGHIAMWFNVEVENGRAGECAPETREVRVSWDEWQTMDNAQHENIVFHELAHCLLNREHDDTTKSLEGIVDAPATLMNSKMIAPSTYRTLRKHYHQELFGRLLPDQSYTTEAFP